MPASKVGLQLSTGHYSARGLYNSKQLKNLLEYLSEEHLWKEVPTPPHGLIKLAQGKRNRIKPEIKVQATLFGLIWEGVHANSIGWESTEREPLPTDELERIEAMHGRAVDSFIPYPGPNAKEWKGGGGVSLAAHFAGVSQEAARRWFRELNEPSANYLSSTDDYEYVNQVVSMIEICYRIEKKLGPEIIQS